MTPGRWHFPLSHGLVHRRYSPVPIVVAMTDDSPVPPLAPRTPPPSSSGSGPGKPNEPPWWLPYLPQIISALKEIGRGVANYAGEQAEREAKAEAAKRKHSLTVLVLLISFLGLIVLFMGLLTFWGKVSGDALLFLVGAVASWILFTVQRHLFEVEPESDEEPLIPGL